MKDVICIAGLKQAGPYRETLVLLRILTLYFLYIQETILYINEDGRCVTNYHIHPYNTRTNSHYHQHIHNIQPNCCRLHLL